MRFSGFERFLGLGRAVRCLVPFGCRRFMHLVYLYGYYGADFSAEKLQLTWVSWRLWLGDSLVLWLVIST